MRLLPDISAAPGGGSGALLELAASSASRIWLRRRDAGAPLSLVRGDGATSGGKFLNN